MVARRRDVPETRTARRRDRDDEPTTAAGEAPDDGLDPEPEDPEPPRSERRTRRDERATEPDPEPEEPRRSARASRSDKPALPPGVGVGWGGAEKVLAASHGGPPRIALTKTPQLIKFLEDAPFVTYQQHWAAVGGGGNRPYTCIGRDECPLCGIGDNPSGTFGFNVLHFTADGEPEVKVLQMGIKAFKAVKELSENKAGEPEPSKDFWAISRTGDKKQTQTNFRPVKERDLEDDWPEVLEHFDLDDLDEILDEAEEKLFDHSVVSISTRKELRDVAKYLAEDPDDGDTD